MDNLPIDPGDPYVFSPDGKLTVTSTDLTSVKLRTLNGQWWYCFEEKATNGTARRLYQVGFNERHNGYRMAVMLVGRQVTFTLSKDENGDLMLGYEVQPCTVSFNMMGHGSQIPDQTDEYYEKAQKPADPTEEGYTFEGWFEDENCTEPYDWDYWFVTEDITLYAKWTKNPREAVYVVSLWDVDEDGVATFGAATGATASCLDCAHKDGAGCIHNDSWEDIAGNLATNPEYYDACIQIGCTKNVPLKLNDTIFSGTEASAPSSVLKKTVNTGYLTYNKSGNTGDCESANWATSRIRATLNGYNNGYSPFTPSTYAGNDCLTTDNCLLSCFPKELQNIIVPKTYEVPTAWATSTPYQIIGSTHVSDKLWLPSAIEIFGTTVSAQYIDYGEPILSRTSITATDFSGNKTFDENGTDSYRLLRSPCRTDRSKVMAVNNSGALTNVASNYAAGLSPCFCIFGKD